MSLKDSLQAYLNLVQAELAVIRPNTTSIELARNSSHTHSLRQLHSLRVLVEALESREEFQTLVRETARSFSKKTYEDRPFDRGLWSINVEAFFRRSGFYLSAYTGEALNSDTVLDKYVEAFQKEKVSIRHLVPLEFVEFDGGTMDFGAFRIIEMSHQELLSVLQSEINKIFYPYAYADLSNLAGLWFLEVTETIDALEPGSGGMIEISGPEVGVTFTRFPSKIVYALKHLALYDWGTYQSPFPVKEKPKTVPDLDTGWDRFHLPFIISIEENPLWDPKPLPDLSVLAVEPYFADDGEQIGYRNVCSIFVESDKFKGSIQRIVDLLLRLEEKRVKTWPFLDTALDYLVKAFFADGLDQLLWHMVVFESLLGDKGDSERGLTNRLKERGAYVATRNGQISSKKMKEIIDDLYKVRSELVHGNTSLFNRIIYLGHLREARELARKASLWFLELLANLDEQASLRENSDKEPTREDIIEAIDVLSNPKLNAGSVKFALNVLSTN